MISFWQSSLLLKGRPREDFFAFDVKTGAFAVADGVGLWEGIEYTGRYPSSSGSGRLSRAFCQAFVRYFKKHPRAGIVTGFIAGNTAAKKVNRHRSKYDVFQKHRGFFAATAAMIHLKGQTLEWAHLGDAGVMVIGPKGEVRLRRDSCPNYFPWPSDVGCYKSSTWTFFARTLARNAVDKENRPMGYGVITGELEAIHYLESGALKLSPDEVVVLYTDGFTPYLEVPEFRRQISQLESEVELSRVVNDLLEKNTVHLRKALKNYRFDSRLNIEVLEERWRKILGRHFNEVRWVKEKSLLLIKN